MGRRADPHGLLPGPLKVRAPGQGDFTAPRRAKERAPQPRLGRLRESRMTPAARRPSEPAVAARNVHSCQPNRCGFWIGSLPSAGVIEAPRRSHPDPVVDAPGATLAALAAAADKHAGTAAASPKPGTSVSANANVNVPERVRWFMPRRSMVAGGSPVQANAVMRHWQLVADRRPRRLQAPHACIKPPASRSRPSPARGRWGARACAAPCRSCRRARRRAAAR